MPIACLLIESCTSCFRKMMMIAMASQAKRIGRVLVWTRSSRRLTDLRKLDKRLCEDRRICVPWRKRLHRPMPQCRCIKCWKLSSSLYTGSFRKIILIRLKQLQQLSEPASRSFGRRYVDIVRHLYSQSAFDFAGHDSVARGGANSSVVLRSASHEESNPLYVGPSLDRCGRCSDGRCLHGN